MIRCHITGSHGCAQLPSDDVLAAIIQDRAVIIPPPANDLEVGEVGLSHLGDGRGFVFELISGFDHHIIGRSDQIGRLHNAVS